MMASTSTAATRSTSSQLSPSHRSVWTTKCFLLISLAYRYGCTANSSFHYPDWCSPAPSSSWTRPFLVALLTDPHMGAVQCSPDGLDCEALVRTAATHVKRLQPDLILWAGDLLQERQDEESYERLKAILEDMSDRGGERNNKIPYYVIPGNTDVGGVPTLERLNAFQERWQLPYYWYTVEYYNTRFLMLDSNILRNRDNDEADDDIVQLAWEEMKWLGATLDASTGEFPHVIAIAHHPLAVQALDEATSSENTPRLVRLDLASIYQQHIGTLKLILSGHLHYAGRIGGQTPQQQYVAYPATTFILGEEPRDDPSGFALLKIDGDRVDEQYYGYNDIPLNRPESEEPGFEFTFPSGEKNLVADSQICITWTSQSMTNYVRLDYSLDAGQSWSLIADQVPNEGAWPWTIPLLPFSNNQQQAAQFLVRISSVYNRRIFASQIVLLENNDNTGENDDDESTTTTNNTNNTAQASSSSQGTEDDPTPSPSNSLAPAERSTGTEDVAPSVSHSGATSDVAPLRGDDLFWVLYRLLYIALVFLLGLFLL